MENINEQKYLAETIDKLESLNQEYQNRINDYENAIEDYKARISMMSKQQYKDQNSKDRASKTIQNYRNELNLASAQKAELQKAQEELAILRKGFASTQKELIEAKRANNYAYNLDNYNKVNKKIETLESKNKKAQADLQEMHKRDKAKLDNASKKIKEEVDLKNEALAAVDIKKMIYRDVIVPKFKEKFPLIISKYENIDTLKISKLARAVMASRKAEKRHNSDKAYNTLVDEMADAYVQIRNNYETKYKRDAIEKFKAFDEEFGVSSPEDTIKKIIDNKTEVKVKDLMATNKKVKLASVVLGVVVAGIVLTFVGLFSGASVDKKNLIDSANNIVGQQQIETTYETIKTNTETGDLLNNILSDEGVKEHIKNIGEVVDGEKQAEGYNKVIAAHEEASKLNKNTENIINDFKNAINTGKDVKDKAQQVVDLDTEMDKQSQISSEGLNEMAGATSVKVAELKKIADIVKEPVVSIAFDKEVFEANRNYFSNPNKGGATLEISSCEYVKETGKATILAKCVDRMRNEYTNLIEIQMEKGLINVDAETILDSLRIQNNKNVSMKAFDKDLAFEMNGGNNQMGSETVANAGSIKYSTTESYSSKSNVTKITGTAIVVNGSEIKTYKVELPFKGKVSASEKEDQIKKALAEKIGIVLEAGSEIEM